MNNINEYYEKLTWFKENEKPEVLLTVADNSKAIKTVIALTDMSTRPVDN